MSDDKMPTDPVAPEEDETGTQHEKGGEFTREDEPPKPATEPADPYKTRT